MSLSLSVVVVGAGITGASIAFHLSSQGVRVTLIERRYPAAGPTGYSTAGLHAFYLHPELSQLAYRGTEILRNLPELTGGEAGFTEVGTLWVCGPDQAQEYAAAVERIRGYGAKIEALAPDQMIKLVPDFDFEGVALGVWEPTAGYADPSTATNSIVEGAKKHGARVLLQVRVSRLLASGSRVTGVEMDTGEEIQADVVVVAAGPWTKPLVTQVGVDLPTFIERHSMAVVDTPTKAREVMPVVWTDDLLSNYSRPEGENLVLVGTWAGGGTGYRNVAIERERVVDPDSYKSTVDDEEALRILSTITPRVPAIANYAVRPGYAGLYDMSPDDNPLHGWAPGVGGLFIAAGTSGHGFKLGPSVGEAVARAIITGELGLLAPFRVDREFVAETGIELGSSAGDS